MNIVPIPPIHQLSIGKAFEGLSPKEKRYAHYMARAAWEGTRIILRQVSPESISIFDFIIEAFVSCSGDWDALVAQGSLSKEDCDAFLDYAATFLSNVGNYYGHGDQKFVPSISAEALKMLSSRSPKLGQLYEEMWEAMIAVPPYSLGYPSQHAQSMYYPHGPEGNVPSEIEIATVSQTLETLNLYPENTRIRKLSGDKGPIFEVMQASVDQNGPSNIANLGDNGTIQICGGDHSDELAKICDALSHAKEYAANENQQLYLSKYIESFKTGDLDVYRDSQRIWIKDKSPTVENIFGFVEPYRDPYGIRAEFEGLVAIKDRESTELLLKLVEQSDKFIMRLPWAAGRGSTEENGGKGPFEKALFEPPDFSSISALAYCSSIIFPGINLPNYNDIREECGFKNVIVANRMSAESNPAQPCPFIDPTEVEQFQKHKYPGYYLWVVLHELLGHGTGRMMTEEAGGKKNFDAQNPPINPVTGEPIKSWYLPGQTWTGQFGALATTVDECRAELVGAYLMDDSELLEMFGYNDKSEITAAELTYNLYQQLGVDGLRGLANFNEEDQKWGQAHSRAHFAILKCLLTTSSGCVKVAFDKHNENLTVQVDRSKIISHGKPALGQMLLKLHMFRCTADVEGCREYYEYLSRVDGEYLEWRRVVQSKKQPKWVFVQANTFIDGEDVVLKEYTPTARGVVQSWAERKV